MASITKTSGQTIAPTTRSCVFTPKPTAVAPTTSIELCSKHLSLPKYQKIQISTSHTFSKIIDPLLGKHKAWKTLSKPDILDMLLLKDVKV
jgi:hypothetical protein